MLLDITLLLLAAALAAPLGKLSRVGSVLAFVGVGVLIGPWGLRLIDDSDSILHFSEIGVVFLLFIIGLELQPRRLWALRRYIFGAGSLQVMATALVLFGLLVLVDVSWQPALVIGYGLALSSTAFALRLLADNNQLYSAHGKLAFGILLFQDLAVIPLLALIPILAAGMNDIAVRDDGIPAWAGPLVLVIFIVAARYLLIPFLRLVAWTRVNEAFTATALLLVLGSALVMDSAGLSMGLGAFLAGVLVADSEYRHQLEVDIEPFKALLLGLFFMAVGMSTNLGVIGNNWLLLLGIVAALVVIKGVLLTVLGILFKLNKTSAVQLGAYLCQGGEFGFVAFTLASGFQLIPTSTRDLLIAAITLSMAVTPVVLKLLTAIANRKSKDEEPGEYSLIEEQHNDLIVAGFGRFGQILGRILNSQGIVYTAVDSSPDQVKLVRDYGNTVFYGNLANHKLLESAGIARAKILALCVEDMENSLKIATLVKKHYPAVKIFARAKNRFHEIRLRELGVDYVIREVLLSSLAFSRELLISLGLEPERSQKIVDTFQAHDRDLVAQQAALINDRQSMIQSTREAAEELKRLLREDRP